MINSTCLFFFDRCTYAVANHDFIEAYKCQTVIVQYPLPLISLQICSGILTSVLLKAH